MKKQSEAEMTKSCEPTKLRGKWKEHSHQCWETIERKQRDKGRERRTHPLILGDKGRETREATRSPKPWRTPPCCVEEPKAKTLNCSHASSTIELGGRNISFCAWQTVPSVHETSTSEFCLNLNITTSRCWPCSVKHRVRVCMCVHSLTRKGLVPLLLTLLSYYSTTKRKPVIFQWHGYKMVQVYVPFCVWVYKFHLHRLGQNQNIFVHGSHTHTKTNCINLLQNSHFKMYHS